MGKSNWCVLRTQVRQEKRVLTYLADEGVLAYAPMSVTWAKFAKRKAKQTRPILPGYVMALLEDDHAITAALDCRLVTSIMATRDGDPIRVPLREMAKLVLCDAFYLFDETYEPPKQKGKRYSHRYSRDDMVRIRSGPFEGRQGKVLEARGRARMAVALTLFGRAFEAVVEHAQLEPAEPAKIAA